MPYMENRKGRKTQITKERITEIAFIMTAENGIDSVSSTTLAKRLNCSTQPIFWVFDTMNDLRQAIFEQALKLYNEYMATNIPLSKYNKSDAIGLTCIQFAKAYPNIYKLIFMTEQKENNISKTDIDGNRNPITCAIKEVYCVTDEIAKKIIERMWVFTHGIATLLVTKTADFNNEQINEMFTDVNMGLLKQYQGG